MNKFNCEGARKMLVRIVAALITTVGVSSLALIFISLIAIIWTGNDYWAKMFFTACLVLIADMLVVGAVSQ